MRYYLYHVIINLETNTKEIATMQLTNQALGAVMMALQNSLMNQTDIVPILQGFDFKSTDDGLVVNNPPVVEVDTQDDETTDATSVFQEFAE